MSDWKTYLSLFACFGALFIFENLVRLLVKTDVDDPKGDNMINIR